MGPELMVSCFLGQHFSYYTRLTLYLWPQIPDTRYMLHTSQISFWGVDVSLKYIYPKTDEKSHLQTEVSSYIARLIQIIENLLRLTCFWQKQFSAAFCSGSSIGTTEICICMLAYLKTKWTWMWMGYIKIHTMFKFGLLILFCFVLFAADYTEKETSYFYTVLSCLGLNTTTMLQQKCLLKLSSFHLLAICLVFQYTGVMTEFQTMVINTSNACLLPF